MEVAVLAKQECFHCGLPVPADGVWSVEIDHVQRPMCCPGCEAVAQTIVANGLSDYYRTRSDFSPTADKAQLVPPGLNLYDAPETAEDFVERTKEDSALCQARFSVEGLRCAACVWLFESRLARVPGLQGVSINVATEMLHVRWAGDRCKPSDILTAMHELGYVAYPFDSARQGEHLRRSEKKLFRQLFVAGLSMMQVMMYAFPAYIADDGTLDADMSGLMRWASLLLTIPAVFYSGLPFFQGAWSNLKNRVLGMDVPVALGVAAAFIGSVVATVQGEGDVYFDTVTMFVFLLLCSRYLELLARRKAASALERMRHALPASASRMPGYPDSRAVEAVPAIRLAEGDLVLIKPGETIAADCVVVEGASAIDAALLTGESRPLHKTVGDALPGGAVNINQVLTARVTRPVRESTLSSLVKLIEHAGQGKPQISLWADRVAAWFVAGLLLFALAVFFSWQFVDPSRAWQVAVAVLVVSCPCALSLATPTALAAATDRLVRQGVLVVQSHVLETLHRATDIIFDKTGTLTEGKPSLDAIEALGSLPAQQCLQIAAALEANSAHPLGRAILRAASSSSGGAIQASDVHNIAGCGLEGSVSGRRFRLGSAAFVGEIAPGVAPRTSDMGHTPIYLGSDGEWLARFELVDAIREDAREVVAHFQSLGKNVILLSGDHQQVAQRVASQLGIKEAYGEQMPDRKLAFVQQLQERGAVVAMAGDGINDAAVLRAADVSFAMGAGAALAQVSADAVLLADRLGLVGDASRAAAQTMAVVRQNLFWATVYNLAAIPAAATGLLNPWMAGIGMSLSSAVVVVNALRLRRVPRQRVECEAPAGPGAGNFQTKVV
jgi:Cu2+-exporting ATPase